MDPDCLDGLRLGVIYWSCINYDRPCDSWVGVIITRCCASVWLLGGVVFEWGRIHWTCTKGARIGGEAVCNIVGMG